MIIYPEIWGSPVNFSFESIETREPKPTRNQVLSILCQHPDLCSISTEPLVSIENKDPWTSFIAKVGLKPMYTNVTSVCDRDIELLDAVQPEVHDWGRLLDHASWKS